MHCSAQEINLCILRRAQLSKSKFQGPKQQQKLLKSINITHVMTFEKLTMRGSPVSYQTLPNGTPPLGKIRPIQKICRNFETQYTIL